LVSSTFAKIAMDGLRPLLVIGTRPEAIKMAPVVQQCRTSADMTPVVCFTGQHREMLAQVAEYFGITADVDLALMRPNQGLTEFTSSCLQALHTTVQQHRPDCLVAQGDTTTVLCTAMVAFHSRLPLVHVEAGLRTGNLQAPWPEEFNRRVAGLTAALHCAPTQRAAENLLREGTPSQSVIVTGNTVIDALMWTAERERGNGGTRWREKHAALEERRMVLITGHRRENFGTGMEHICQAVRGLASRFPDVDFVYPVHLNPHVREPVFRLLGRLSNVHLVPPASYPEFVWLMDRATLILTDSGGVQEEAPSLGKPVLVMRETTERPEAVDAGAVELVGTRPERLMQAVANLLDNPQEYARRQIRENPYGDGRAAARIVAQMRSRLGRSKRAAA
jgi:UDP-N-acetylglucosamine 2-epimerase (non-hydrolysing)